MIIIPAIELRGGRCAKMAQGRAADELNYSENPVNVARRWYDAGAEILHVVNLDGLFGKDDRNNLRAFESILYEVNIPIQFDGGVHSIEDARRIDELGATRIVIGAAAVENPILLEHIVGEFGSTIVVTIDARNGKVTLRNEEKLSQFDAATLAQRVSDLGVERIIYTDIEHGVTSDFNFEAMRQIAELSGLKVAASGEVSSLDDIYILKDLEDYGVDSVIIGKALYEGRFTLEDALDVAAE